MADLTHLVSFTNAPSLGATGRNRTCDVAFGGPHDIHFTTVAHQRQILAPGAAAPGRCPFPGEAGRYNRQAAPGMSVENTFAKAAAKTRMIS